MRKNAKGWLGLAAFGTAAAADSAGFLEARVRPVLANKCYSCHANSALRGQRFDSRERVLKGDKSGAVFPGKLDESLLVRAVRQVDSRLKMPLGGNLTNTEITDLTKCADVGAPWPSPTMPGKGFLIGPEQKRFWAFQPIQRILRSVSNNSRVKSPIDGLILGVSFHS